MNLFHLIWIVFLIALFALGFLVKKGVYWAIVLAVSILMAYFAITGYWEALYFPPIIGIFIISIMGFIHDCLEGRFV